MILPWGLKAQLNQSFKYQTNPPLLHSFVVLKSDSELQVMGEVTFFKEDMLQYRAEYALTNDEAGNTVFSAGVIPESQIVQREQLGTYGYTLDLSAYVKEATFLFISFIHKETNETYTIYRNLNGIDTCPFYFERQFIPHQYPYLRNNDRLKIRALDKRMAPIWVYGYKSQFPQADPPMLITKAQANIPVDTVFTLLVNDTFIPPFEGIFIFKPDSAASTGRSLLVTNPFYPDVKLQEKVREPLVYITTKEEWEELNQGTDIKLQLDKFWLALLPNQERAKSTIKAFYQNVSLANELFTTYKEGWKTDMGMIYIIYGAPTKVLNYGTKEEWIYLSEENNSVLSFTFVHAPTLFSASAYSLIREKKYKNSWYPTIDLWRKGRK
ncbi:GWxTD domain-containing protein [Shiella aurantiaca]|nr:GWxTD domain-containing protein [Shiella aurantiaca]